MHAFQFEFKDLHLRMRKLVRQRNSHTTTTPPRVNVKFSPAAFFVVSQNLGLTQVLKHQGICSVWRLEDLDIIFPPTEEDLLTDDIIHPFYGHSMKSRWYRQLFDLEEEEDSVHWTVLQEVDISRGVQLNYNMKTYAFSVQCSWVGYCKRPNGNKDEWIGARANRHTALLANTAAVATHSTL